jgi:hypothetical protein
MVGEERSRLAIGFALILSIALAASLVSGVGVSDLLAGSPVGGLGAGIGAGGGSSGAAEPDAAGIGGGLSSHSEAGARSVDGCGTIEEPGKYVLTRNITNSQGTRTSQNCLWINTSDVVLEGAGHRIDGIGVTDSVGVYVGSPAPTENVTVRNLTVSDWHKGVWHRDVRDGTLRNVTAENNAIGLGIENATGTRVIDNAASENLIGVRVTRSTLAALQGNTLEDNYGTGIYDELTAIDLFGQRVTVGPPLDPDGDGRYEDVTGDREVGLYDAVSLFGVVNAEAVGVGDLHANQREMLDLDGDSDLDYGDVWTLL